VRKCEITETELAWLLEDAMRLARATTSDEFCMYASVLAFQHMSEKAKDAQLIQARTLTGATPK